MLEGPCVVLNFEPRSMQTYYLSDPSLYILSFNFSLGVTVNGAWETLWC